MENTEENRENREITDKTEKKKWWKTKPTRTNITMTKPTLTNENKRQPVFNQALSWDRRGHCLIFIIIYQRFQMDFPPRISENLNQINGGRK